jgi:hypothetical protein
MFKQSGAVEYMKNSGVFHGKGKSGLSMSDAADGLKDAGGEFIEF